MMVLPVSLDQNVPRL